MPDVRIMSLAIAAIALPACRKEPAQDQNIVITNEIPANADIETLPADESVGTPPDQLQNGMDNADVGDLNAAQNSD